MKDKNELAKGWIRKAESDLTVVRRMLASEGPFDTVCFHCQQAIEKFLKAFLAFQEQQIPRTHDLEELAKLCSLLDETLKWAELDLEEVTDFAVAVRYDLEFWPEHNIAQEALKKSQEVKEKILLRLPSEAKP